MKAILNRAAYHRPDSPPYGWVPYGVLAVALVLSLIAAYGVRLPGHANERAKSGDAVQVAEQSAPDMAPITLFGGVTISLLLFGVILSQFRSRSATKQHTAALEASEVQFRAGFYSMAVGNAQTNPVTGRYLQVNSKFCEITGYSGEELLGMTFSELTHPDDRDSDLAAHRGMVSGEVPSICREKRYVRKDGRVIWVNISASLIRDASGQAVRTLAVVQDVTARREADEERLATEARFRRLVEQSIVGIYVIHDDRFVYVNPKMAEIFGFSQQEMTGAPLLNFIFEPDRALVGANVRKRLAGPTESVCHLP